MKRSIKVLIIFAFLVLGFKLNVNAENINNLKTRDIVIGTTRFKAGTWISSTRASKAGALYTNITGSVDVKSYMYITPKIIYEINDDGSYRLLSSEEIGNLEIELNIYYDNNIPLYYEYKTAESGEMNEVDYFFWRYNTGIVTLNDPNVIIDSNNETITCPFGHEFKYSVKYCEDESCLSEEVYNYIGICDFDYNFKTIEEDNSTPIYIEQIKSSDYYEYLNQNKVEFNESPYQTLIDLKVKDKLESFVPSGHYYDDTYYAIDLLFEQNNNTYCYTVYSDSDYQVVNRINQNKMTILLPINMYSSHEFFDFVILDSCFSTYSQFSVVVEGLDKVNADFELNNISKVDSSVNVNSNNIDSIIMSEDENRKNVDIKFNNPLEIITHNEIEGRWVTLDLEFNESYNLEHLDIEYDKDEQIDYEIIGDKLRIWINMDLVDFSNLWLYLYYNLTNGKPMESINMNFDIESDYITYMWGNDIDSAGKSYLYVVNGIGTKIPGRVNVTYKNTEYSEDIIVSDYGILLFKDLVTINSVSDLKEGE